MAMRLCKWEQFELAPNGVTIALLAGVAGPKGSPGFAMVFDSQDDAREWYGDDVSLIQIELSVEPCAVSMREEED